MARQARLPASAAASQALLDSITSLKDSSAAEKACADVRQYLEPVLSAARSQKGSLTAPGQRLAKPYSSFVVHLLRLAMLQVTNDQASDLQLAYVQLAALGLNGLSVLRGCLKGRPHEVEIQRYMLLRKLVSLRLFEQAVQQAWLLYQALTCRCWQPNNDSLMRDLPKQETWSLPAPESHSAEVSSLVVGTVLNLFISIVEQGRIKVDLPRVMSVINDFGAVMAWLW